MQTLTATKPKPTSTGSSRFKKMPRLTPEARESVFNLTCEVCHGHSTFLRGPVKMRRLTVLGDEELHYLCETCYTNERAREILEEDIAVEEDVDKLVELLRRRLCVETFNNKHCCIGFIMCTHTRSFCPSQIRFLKTRVPHIWQKIEKAGYKVREDLVGTPVCHSANGKETTEK